MFDTAQKYHGSFVRHSSQFVITLAPRGISELPEWAAESEPVMDPGYVQECIDSHRLVSVKDSVHAVVLKGSRPATRPLHLSVRTLRFFDRACRPSLVNSRSDQEYPYMLMGLCCCVWPASTRWSCCQPHFWHVGVLELILLELILLGLGAFVSFGQHGVGEQRGAVLLELILLGLGAFVSFGQYGE
jgi:hypothetical protein